MNTLFLLLALAIPSSAQMISVNTPASSASGATAGQDINSRNGVFETLRATSTTHGLTVDVASTFIGSDTHRALIGGTSIYLSGNLGIDTLSPSKRLHVSSGAIQVDGTGGQFRYDGDAGVMALRGIGGGRGLFLDSSVGALLTGVGSAAVPYFQANAGEANVVAAGGNLACTTAGCGFNAAGNAGRSLSIWPRAADQFAIITTTGSSTSQMSWGIDKFGHVVSSGSTPTLGTCTNGAILGGSTDVAGRLTFSGANSSCAIVWNFAAQPAQTVACSISANMATPAVVNTATTGTGMTVTATSFANTDYVNYVCYRFGGTY
jgi:hypothetical protein